MDKKQTILEANKIFKTIFGKECPYNLGEILNKFAFDVKLPQKVHDSTTGEITWTQSINSSRFIKQVNMEAYDEKYGWIQPKKEVQDLNELLKQWKRINYTTTERVYDCINVSESDPLYRCENVFRSTDLRNCKNAIFSDGSGDCESIIACQRTSNSAFCIRVDDSNNCTNSYNVICSIESSHSFFIPDANNMNACMFCSHMYNQRYYIANMPFEAEEYFAIKAEIIKWILSNN